MALYYYARVSSIQQNLDRQLAQCKEVANKKKETVKLYSDRQSGKDFCRDGYQALKKKLEKGDVLYISSLDRLGRNYNGIIDEWREITSKGVDIVVLDMPILDTTQNKDLIGTLITDIVLQLLSYVAESERTRIKQRQAEGIAAMKARGDWQYYGRPTVLEKLDPQIVAQQVKYYKAGEISGAECARRLQISRSAWTKYKKEILFIAEHGDMRGLDQNSDLWAEFYQSKVEEAEYKKRRKGVSRAIRREREESAPFRDENGRHISTHPDNNTESTEEE